MTGPPDWDALLHRHVQDTFGEVVQYRPRGGDAFPVTGVFDNAWHASDEVSGSIGLSPVHVVNTAAILGVRLAAFPAPPQQGDSITARGKSYSVQEVRDDSHGHAYLILNEGDVPDELPQED